MQRFRCGLLACLAAITLLQAVFPCCVVAAALTPRTGFRCCPGCDVTEHEDERPERPLRKHAPNDPTAPCRDSECPFCTGTVLTKADEFGSRDHLVSPGDPQAGFGNPALVTGTAEQRAGQALRTDLLVACDLLMLGRLLL